MRTAIISDWTQSVKTLILGVSSSRIISLLSNNYRGTKVKLTGMRGSSHWSHRKELVSEVFISEPSINLNTELAANGLLNREYRRMSMDHHSSKSLRKFLSKYVMLLRISIIAHRLKKEKYMDVCYGDSGDGGHLLMYFEWVYRCERCVWPTKRGRGCVCLAACTSGCGRNWNHGWLAISAEPDNRNYENFNFQSFEGYYAHESTFVD